LRDVSSAEASALLEAWMDWKVLFFRDQHITVPEQITFARLFGEPEIHPIFRDPEYPELFALDSQGRDPYQANYWHTDVTFQECPPMGSVLRGRIIPEVGGDTCFANMERVYECLDDATKAKIDGLSARHSFLKPFGPLLDEEARREKLAEFPEQVHPLARTHPITGRKSLFVSSPFIVGIEGMEPAEGDALLRRLYREPAVLEHQVRFRWRPDSVAMWDNRCTQHWALADYQPAHRRVERVTLAGDRPF
jgi:taurine dioxygenase